jgi:hypothetical protein
MVIFNSYVKLPEGIPWLIDYELDYELGTHTAWFPGDFDMP